MVSRILSPEVDNNNAEMLKTIAQMQRRIEEQQHEICALQRLLQMQMDVQQVAASVEDRFNSISKQVETRTADCERQLRDYVTAQVSAVTTQVSAVNTKVERMATGERVEALEQKVSRLKEAEQGRKREFTYNGPRELDGIIAFLTRLCGGNVHEKGVVTVKASSFHMGADCQAAAVDLLGDSVFHTADGPGQYCCYDFNARRVSLKSYTIRSYCPPFNWPGHHPLSWVVEVSNDSKDWKIVDSHTNDRSLAATHVTRNFRVSSVPDGSFRFVRLRHTGINSNNTQHLIFCAFELFGTLFDQ